MRKSAPAPAPEVDIALDPLEGTTLTAKDFPNALTVIAMAPTRVDAARARRLHGQAGNRPRFRARHGDDGHVTFRARARFGQSQGLRWRPTSPFACWNARATKT